MPFLYGHGPENDERFINLFQNDNDVEVWIVDQNNEKVERGKLLTFAEDGITYLHPNVDPEAARKADIRLDSEGKLFVQ